MGYLVTRHNPTDPFTLSILVPDRLIKEIMDGGDEVKAISLARAILSGYQPTGRDKVYLRHFEGHKFVLNFSEDVDPALKEIFEDFMLHGTYEPATTKLIKEHVGSGMTCVDAGASLGYFTLLMARQAGPTGRVYAIEPTTNQFPYLKHNVEVNGYADRVTLINKAAGDQTGTMTIQCNAMNSHEVEAVPLDLVLNGQAVDLIKIDTDGSDLRVLKGFEETIKRSPNLKMVVEFYPKYLENLGTDPTEMLAFLDKYFTHQKIDGDYGDGCWNLFCQRKLTE